MKTIASNLKSAIADDGTVATCVKITRKDSVVKGFTNHDIPLTVSGVTYQPLPALERIVMKLRNNAEISNQDFAAAFVVDLDEEDITNGLYNDASFDVYYVNWADPTMGAVTIFAGHMGNIQWNNDGFAVDVFNLVHKLDGSIGNIITGKCRHQLYSQIGDSPDQIGYCGVSKAANTFTGTVGTINTQKLNFDFSGFTPSADDLANGVLEWTFGDNIGLKGEVKTNDSNTISLFLPTNFLIQTGDEFTVTKGCDKTIGTCNTKFSNVVNFGGFPFIGEK